MPSVLQALLAPLPYRLTEGGTALAPPPAANGATISPDEITPVQRTSRPLDMLVVILRNVNANMPAELGVNVCTLLSSIAKGPSRDVMEVKKSVSASLRALAGGSVDMDTTPTGASQLLQSSAKKTLEVFGLSSTSSS